LDGKVGYSVGFFTTVWYRMADLTAVSMAMVVDEVDEVDGIV